MNYHFPVHYHSPLPYQMSTGNRPINAITSKRISQLQESDIIMHIVSLFSHLALRLSDILTNILGSIWALLHKDGLTGLGLPLHPDDGLVGGHVHTELLVVQVHRLARLGGSPVTVLSGEVGVSSSPLLLRGLELRSYLKTLWLVGLPWVLGHSRLDDNSPGIGRDGGDDSGDREEETQPHGVADWSLFGSIRGCIGDKTRTRTPPDTKGWTLLLPTESMSCTNAIIRLYCS